VFVQDAKEESGCEVQIYLQEETILTVPGGQLANVGTRKRGRTKVRKHISKEEIYFS